MIRIVSVVFGLTFLVAAAGNLQLHEFALPAVEFSPGAIAVDPRGNVWFAEDGGYRIGELQANGAFRIIELPRPRSQIQNLAVATDGTLWFTETQTEDGSENWIGKVAAGGTITVYPLRRPNAFVMSIAPATDGGVWVSEFDGGRVAHVSAKGAITEFALPSPSGDAVRSLVSDPDGSVWVARNDAVAHVFPSGRLQYFPLRLPAGVEIRNIVRASRSSFWLTRYEQRGDPASVWRFTPPRTLTRFTIPGSELGPILLVPDRAGGAWYPYLDQNIIGHIDESGTLTEYPIAIRGSDITGMVLGTGGGLWFTNLQSEKLGFFGRTVPAPRPVVSPLSAAANRIIQAWRAQLQPREAYNMSEVTPDTLTVVRNFAVVGWSDLDGNAATLLRNSNGTWRAMAVTNGNFNQLPELTAQGVPAAIAAQLLTDANVELVP